MTDASAQYRRGARLIHEVLIREWDPIGVGKMPQTQDEYDSYIPVIYRLLAEGADDNSIARHLESIETDAMGLRSQGEKNMLIAKRLRIVFNAAR